MRASVVRALTKVLGGASLKGICHNDRASFALVSETLRRKTLLQRALADAGLAHAVEEGGKTHAEALLAAHELLFGRGLRARGKGAVWSPNVRFKLLRWQARLLRASKGRPLAHGQSTRFTGRRGLSSALPRLPRYVRVNTLLARTADVVAVLQREGYTLESAPALGCREMWRTVGVGTFTSMGPKSGMMWMDETVPDLLVLPAGLELHRHQMVKHGTLILQDKASCFTPVALAPREGEALIDCCAAPGNKTSQLAALAAPGGSVVAVERDPTRARMLRARLATVHADSLVRVIEGDFLSVSPEENPWRDATAVLLDPSCSGSGMVERQIEEGEEARDSVHGSAGNSTRLRALAALQVRLLLHALRLPKVRRVAYSTCSVHPLENEVVALTVASQPDVVDAGWRLVHAIPSWPCRGIPLSDDVRSECEKMVRAGPEWLTNGFFVAMFERSGNTTEEI